MTQPCKQAGPDLLERDKGPSAGPLRASLTQFPPFPELPSPVVIPGNWCVFFFLLFILCGVKGLGEYILGLGMSEKLKSRKEWLRYPVPNTLQASGNICLAGFRRHHRTGPIGSQSTCRPPTGTTCSLRLEQKNVLHERDLCSEGKGPSIRAQGCVLPRKGVPLHLKAWSAHYARSQQNCSWRVPAFFSFFSFVEKK